LKGGVVATIRGMAECAAMAATRRCHQGGCWTKTDEVTVVLVRFFSGVVWSWLKKFFDMAGRS